jgi:hypothetical protein
MMISFVNNQETELVDGREHPDRRLPRMLAGNRVTATQTVSVE